MDNEKYIVSASFRLDCNSLSISRYKLISETKAYYCTVDKYRNPCSFLKDNIGKPILNDAGSATVRVFMIDADNDTLIKLLCKWFTDKAQEILKIKVTK